MERDRDKEEAVRVLKELLIRTSPTPPSEGAAPVEVSVWADDFAKWESKVEVFVYHIIESAARKGRGQING